MCRGQDGIRDLQWVETRGEVTVSRRSEGEGQMYISHRTLLNIQHAQAAGQRCQAETMDPRCIIACSQQISHQ